jgi:formimidoylglutamate deiminase
VRLWAPQAFIDGRWQQGALLSIDRRGCFSEVAAGVPGAPAGATVLPGPVLPGLVDAHSHAFQRAFAGLSERRAAESDDFWSWRDRMYGVALRITPEQLRAVAAQLYAELLVGGYTQVCEFHYLHHAPDGAPYPDADTLGNAVADAAGDAGPGFTYLPVLYERAGFSAPLLRADQRRFKSDAALVLRLARAMQAARRPHVTAGVAVHSLRAASAESIDALLTALRGEGLPIHLHVSEQQQEVEDCLAATGKRPIEWLCARFAPDRRFQLVHATHTTPAEIEAIARSGAGVVLCPSTEGNLGDGLADLPGLLGAGVPLSIGSDSQLCRSWTEELRWLEYGQRLALRRRNVAAAPQSGQPSTAARLFEVALHAGASAAGLEKWGLVAGARADALVVDVRAEGIAGVPASHWLDAAVFATGQAPFAEVYVGGRRVVVGGKHVDGELLAHRFARAMETLWGEGARLQP